MAATPKEKAVYIHFKRHLSKCYVMRSKLIIANYLRRLRIKQSHRNDSCLVFYIATFAYRRYYTKEHTRAGRQAWGAPDLILLFYLILICLYELEHR